MGVATRQTVMILLAKLIVGASPQIPLSGPSGRKSTALLCWRRLLGAKRAQNEHFSAKQRQFQESQDAPNSLWQKHLRRLDTWCDGTKQTQTKPIHPRVPPCCRCGPATNLRKGKERLRPGVVIIFSAVRRQRARRYRRQACAHAWPCAESGESPCRCAGEVPRRAALPDYPAAGRRNVSHETAPATARVRQFARGLQMKRTVTRARISRAERAEGSQPGIGRAAATGAAGGSRLAAGVWQKETRSRLVWLVLPNARTSQPGDSCQDGAGAKTALGAPDASGLWRREGAGGSTGRGGRMREGRWLGLSSDRA